MAKGDQSSGCSCGLYKACQCFKCEPVPSKPRARFKITDVMVEAAVEVFNRTASEDGYHPPTEAEDPAVWAKMRAVVKEALQAAAKVAQGG